MSPDFKELLAEFNARNVDYIVVGAHALAAHGIVRATKDLDIWIRPTQGNAQRVLEALDSYGAALYQLTVEELLDPDVIFQMGVEPIRIDILSHIPGIEFENAWLERIETTFGGVPTSVISRDHFIQNKRATGREQDLLDIKELEALGPKS